jgi:hypothetical protein
MSYPTDQIEGIPAEEKQPRRTPNEVSRVSPASKSANSADQAGWLTGDDTHVEYCQVDAAGDGGFRTDFGLLGAAGQGAERAGGSEGEHFGRDQG